MDWYKYVFVWFHTWTHAMYLDIFQLVFADIWENYDFIYCAAKTCYLMFLSFLAVMGIFLVILLLHISQLVSLLINHDLEIYKKNRANTMWVLGRECGIGEIPVERKIRQEALLLFSNMMICGKEIKDMETGETDDQIHVYEFPPQSPVSQVEGKIIKPRSFCPNSYLESQQWYATEVTEQLQCRMIHNTG